MGIARPRSDSGQRYSELVQTIRDQRGRSAALDVQAMLLILDLESQPVLWRPYAKTFVGIIQRERFCTVHRWKSFKKAREMFPRRDRFVAEASRLGIEAICLIALQAKTKHFRLLGLARSFRNKHEIEPTYQYISRLVGRRKPKGPSRRELLRQVEAQARDIETLKRKLRDHKIRIPKLETT